MMSERRVRYFSAGKIFEQFRWVGIGVGFDPKGRWWDKCLLLGLGIWTILLGPHWSLEIEKRSSHE
jgi:hypothetical protein